MRFPGSHIFSIDQLERPDIDRIFTVVDQVEKSSRPVNWYTERRF